METKLFENEIKNEFQILSEYCKGETFYYYYSPSNQILKGTFGKMDYKVDGVKWIARKYETDAITDQRNHLKSLVFIDGGKVPSRVIQEDNCCICEIMREAVTAWHDLANKPKSEFEILNEEKKNVFDSGMKLKIKQIIFTKENAIATLKQRLDNKIGSDYQIAKDYQAIAENMDKIRLLQELIK